MIKGLKLDSILYVITVEQTNDRLSRLKSLKIANMLNFKQIELLSDVIVKGLSIENEQN